MCGQGQKCEGLPSLPLLLLLVHTVVLLCPSQLPLPALITLLLALPCRAHGLESPPLCAFSLVPELEMMNTTG